MGIDAGDHMPDLSLATHRASYDAMWTRILLRMHFTLPDCV